MRKLMAVAVTLSVAPLYASSIAHAQHRVDLAVEDPASTQTPAKEGFGVGVTVRGVSCQRPLPLPLEFTVTWFSPTDFMPGDKVTFEVSVKNISSQPIDVPWSRRRLRPAKRSALH